MSAPEEIRTVGTSMLPAIWPGSRLHVRAADGAVRCGDVVVYPDHGDKLVAHRVIGIAERDGATTLTVCGDLARDAVELPLHAAAYVVERVERGPLGYDTGGPVGRALARLALHNGLAWKGARIGARVLRRVAGIVRRARIS